MTREEFNLMCSVISGKECQIGDGAGQSLVDFGYLNANPNKILSVTDDGRDAMEVYRVKRAIFIVAGFGSRLVPITLNTPKPLVRVHGARIVDTLLDAVVSAGIDEIIMVRGYLGEQFDQLLYKYPNIKFVENPNYLESNNISSAMPVRHLLKNSYMCDGDLIIRNKSVITPYQYSSNYLGIPVERTDDWCLHSDAFGVITGMSVGGVNCHQMVGISYWSEADGAKLESHIKSVYEQPGGKERYWDQVALQYYLGEYKIEVRECPPGDVVEIDTFSELKAIDPIYRI